MINKFLAYEYAVRCFLQWKAELNNSRLENVRLSKTQTLKLLFLVAAIPNAEGKDLLDVFNRFYAMQFGPVESDILNGISDGEFCFLARNDSLLSASSLGDEAFSSLDEGVKQRIDQSIACLRANNQGLVRYPATKLVDITHKWWCWKQTFHVARLLNRGSLLMRVESIRMSNKVFE